jgi:hypothetical protein
LRGDNRNSEAAKTRRKEQNDRWKKDRSRTVNKQGENWTEEKDVEDGRQEDPKNTTWE